MWRVAFVLIVLVCPLAWAKPKPAELCREARKLMLDGQVNQGMDKYLAALKLDPDYVPAHAGLGQHLARCAQQSSAQGDEKQASSFYDAAFKHLNRAVKGNSKDATSLFWRGECYFDRKADASALRDYNRSIALKSDWPTHLARAVCHSRMGHDDLAVTDYDVVWKQTKDPMCLYNRGNCYRRLGKRKLAEADYHTVVRSCKEEKTVEWARRSLKEMQEEAQSRDYRHPATGVKVSGSFSYKGEFYRCRGAGPMSGGSPGEIKISHSSDTGEITTYIFSTRQPFEKEWADARYAIENGPMGKGRLLKESRPAVAGFEQAHQALYSLPGTESLVALLSFKGHHIKVRITAGEDTRGLASQFLGRLKAR